MQMKTNSLIRITALAIAAYGLYVVVPGWRFLFDPDSIGQMFKGDMFFITGFLSCCFYIFMILSAYCLFVFKPSGRKFSLVVVSIQFVLTLAGIIRWWWLSAYPPPIPAELQSIDPSSLYVKVVSIWPSYVITLICLFLIVFLGSKKVTQEYSNFIGQKL
jgi:hypothetical protein